MNRKIILTLILIITSIGQSMANSYYAQLVTKVATSSSGMGKVYARDTTATYTGEFRSDSCAADYKGNKADTNMQFLAYAQSVDESRYVFSGWSETDGGAIISKDNPYQVTVTTATQATARNYKYVYANFLEKVLCKATFVEPSNGTYTATDGTQTITGSGTISTREQLSLTATPNEGYKLVGWYKLLSNGEKSYFSFEPNATFILTEDEKIGVDYIKIGTPLFIIKGGTKAFTDLNDANNAAETGDVIYLSGSATLPKGDYTIKEGVTLLIPFDSDNTCYDETNTPLSSSVVTTPNPYCTLTLAKDAKINVNGTISVSSNIYAIGTKASEPAGGHVNGDYGMIKMEDGSSIIVNNGGKLFVSGYILGNGKIKAEDGSHVYEMFQLSDFRGGTCLNEIVESDYKVYPLNQYFIQNIEVPMTLTSGAEESVMTGFYGDGKDLTTTLFTFIGSNGLFVLEEGSTLEKYFDSENDRQVYNVSGDASIGSLSMKMNGVIVDSKSFVLPLTNNLSMTIQSGTFTINNENGIALLPDAKLTVNKGAKLLVQDSKFIVYDEDEWGEYTGIKRSKPYQFRPITSPSMTYVRTSLSDATLDVQGTVETDNGMLYTTKSGANICCTKGKGKIILNNGEIESNTYQVVQNVTVPTYVSIPITPAQLKNTSTEDAAYTMTEDAEQGATFYFHQETGIWDNDNISTSIDKVDEANVSTTIWSVNGVKQEKLKSGLNIVKSSDGTVKKVMAK